MNVKAILKHAAAIASKNSPSILTGVGIAGFLTTVVMTAKAAPSASRIHKHESAIRENADHSQAKESYISETKQLLPLYGPPALVGTLSIACFLSANKIQADRKAAIMAAYSLSEKTLSTYQKKVIEKLGEDAGMDIFDEATKEVVRSETPIGDEHLAPVVPAGTVRCFDAVTGRYFYSSREAIVSAESEINKRLVSEVRVPLQEFYYELGLDERFALGDVLGWDVTGYSGNDAGALSIWFTPMLDDDKNPCLVLNYHVAVFDRHA